MKLNWKTLFLLTTCCTLGLMTTAKAQITPDNSLGAESSTLGQPNQAINGIPINQIDQINGGARRGGNLFHSFGEFNVNAGRGAYFSNPAGIANILTRVTGVNRSNILGTLGVLGNANLFLINPNGIFFGPNSSLDLGGSFFGSSANSLLFDNGFEFSATNPQAPPLLTVNIPIGLRFRDSPGNITNQSVVEDNTGFGIGLQVNPGNSLALIGGNVSLEQGGRLTAAGGRIELGGLTGAGTVGLQTTGNTFRLNFPTNGLSNVSLLDDARVAVRSNGGGDIVVNTNIFTATNGGRLVGGIEGIATRNGGDITVNSNEFNISGVGLQSEFAAGIAQQVVDGASGNAGNIFVNTKSFNASSGGQLQNTVLFTGTGNAGNISITSNLLSLTNAVIDSSTSGRGNAGNISLQVGDAIALTDSSTITTNVQQGGSGIGGDIDIRGRSLTLTGGSQIQAGLFAETNGVPGGNGTGGSIKINASDFVDISGFNPVSLLQSGIFAPAETGSTGPGGSIDITTGAFRLTNFGIVNAETANGNNGGDITINAKTFEATNGLVQTILSGRSQTDGLFSAGDIQLNVTDSVSLKDGSIINSSTSGRGNAGNISLQVGDAIALTDFSLITTNVQPGGEGIGGDIDIRGRSLTLTNGSQIQAGLFRQDSGLPGGIGTGGSIKINASDFVDISGFNPVSGLQSGIFAPAETGSTGPGGSIDITTGAFRLSNFGIVNAATANGNNGGDITINAKTFEATNGQVQTILSGRSQTDGLFSAGDIQLNVTDFVSLKDGSEINSSTSGQGNAGNVTLRAENGDISLAGGSYIFSTVERGQDNAGNPVITQRNAGKIDIIAKNLTLADGSQLQTLVRAGQRGNADNITVKASGDVSFSGFNNIDLGGNSGVFPSGIFSQVQSGATGSGGDIKITAKNLSLNNSAQINASTFGIGNAGNVSLQVDDAITLANSSLITSLVGRGGEGIGGDIDIRGRWLTLTGGSQILTALFREGNGLSGGKGRAGNIDINATDFVNIFGVGTTGFSSGLFASAETGTTATSPQAAGNINLTTGNFRIADGAVVNALTDNSGDAGNININANTFTANGGGQVITTTLNSGSAGNINLNVRDQITIAGSDPNFNQRIQGTFDNQGAASGIFANTASGSTGNGGNITIQPLQNRFPTIAISDDAEVTVDSQGQGRGGEISITGNSLTLDRGIISASTQSADGGDITLNLRNFIRLRNESLISTNARGQQGGNGGNITINSPFIVAFPQNNDIIANAVSGSGGRVRTNATLFGIIPRTRADLERLGVPSLNPRNLSTSDITAFSEQNSNFGDNVLVTSPDVDPSRGLVELPETVSDRTQQIAQNPCQQGIGNEFVVTGRGGLPTTPNETLSSDNVRVDLLQPVASSGNSRSATIKPVTTVTAKRVPAQGWIFNDKGQVVLTAYDPTNAGSQRSFSTAAACPAR